MIEVIQADRLAILARHSLTPANRAKYEGAPDSRVQGPSPDMCIDNTEGVLQAYAFGIALRNFVPRHGIEIIAVHASDTVRAKATRNLALEHVPGLAIVAPSQELWEHRKGNLEGRLRSEAYPNEPIRRAAAEEWDFRHGTLETGGETPREAGERWLGWFRRTTQQPDFQPREDTTKPIPTILAFGHNLVTACGITLLNHDSENPLPPVSDRTFKVANATALLLAENDGHWSVLPERLVPAAVDFEAAQMYVAGS